MQFGGEGRQLSDCEWGRRSDTVLMNGDGDNDVLHLYTGGWRSGGFRKDIWWSGSRLNMLTHR